MKKWIFLLGVILLLYLAGCGGGGGPSAPSLPPPTGLTAERDWSGKAPDFYQETLLKWEVVPGASYYKVYMQAEGQELKLLEGKVTSTSYTHKIPPELWTLNIDYFVSAVSETTNIESDKAKVPTDAQQLGPPPPPF